MKLNNQEKHFARFYLDRYFEKPSIKESFPTKQWQVVMAEIEALDIGFYRSKEIIAFVEAIVADNNGSYSRSKNELEENIVTNNPNDEGDHDEIERLSAKDLIRIDEKTIFGKPDYNSIRKSLIYSKRKVSIVRDGSDNDPEIESLFNEMMEFELIVDDLLTSTSQISNKIGLLNKDMQEASSELINYGLRSKKHGTKLILVGAGLSLVGEIYASYKQDKLRRETELKRAELMRNKVEFAKIKLEFIENIAITFNAKSDRFKKLYLKNFDRIIQVNSPTRDLEINTFKKSLFIYIKYIYLLAVFNFMIDEMRAWLNHKENSSSEQPILERIIDLEISEWRTKLLENENNQNTSWDNFINDIIENEKDSYTPPIYLLFSDPFFLRNYIGVDLPGLNNVNDGYIKNLKYSIENNYKANNESENKKNQNIAKPIQEMLNSNDYYLDCKTLANEYKQELPEKFGLGHILAALIFGIPIFFGAKYIWSNLNGWVFALVSMILIIIMSFIRNSILETFYEEYDNFDKEIKRVNKLEIEKASKYRKIKI